jgi:hypothetical protein
LNEKEASTPKEEKICPTCGKLNFNSHLICRGCLFSIAKKVLARFQGPTKTNFPTTHKKLHYKCNATFKLLKTGENGLTKAIELNPVSDHCAMAIVLNCFNFPHVSVFLFCRMVLGLTVD